MDWETHCSKSRRVGGGIYMIITVWVCPSPISWHWRGKVWGLGGTPIRRKYELGSMFKQSVDNVERRKLSVACEFGGKHKANACISQGGNVCTTLEGEFTWKPAQVKDGNTQWKSAKVKYGNTQWKSEQVQEGNTQWKYVQVQEGKEYTGKACTKQGGEGIHS